MKQFLFCVTLTFIFCMHIQGKEKVVKHPPFIAWSSTSIEIDKVVLSDTATILYIKAFYQPKQWICIASQSFIRDNNGETYPLRFGIGINPDKEFWMPESGEAEFQLVFPSIPKSATSIDFSEGDKVDGAFKIWGIQLKGNQSPEFTLPPEAMVHKTDEKETLTEPQLCYGEAVIKGQILDYRPGMGQALNPTLFDLARGPYDGKRANISDSGTFLIKEKVAGITPISVTLFGKRIFLFAVPGQESSLIINSRELCRQQSKLHKDDKPYGKPIYYNGAFAGLCQEFNQCEIETNPIGDYKLFFQKIAGMDAPAYRDYIVDNYQTILKEIEEAPISQALKTMLTNRADIYAAQAISTTVMMLKQAHVRANKLNEEKTKEYFKTARIALPKDYYADGFKRFKSLNTPAILYNSNFAIAGPYLNRLTNEFAAAWNTSKGLFFDLERANRLYKSIADFSPLTTARQDSLLATLPEALQTKIREKNSELLKIIEANKKKDGFNVNELGEITNEDLFASIISKFRGKAILVDIWATWCGPCRMANKAMKPLKAELKDRDIIYLYITGETSPLKTWENMVPDIHGEHFRVTNDQWAYLMKAFNIKGVPTYLLIDREGNIKYKETGFPEVDQMKKELLTVSDER